MMIMVDDTSKKVVFLSNRACLWWYVGVHWRGGSLEPIMIGEWNMQMLFTTFAQITRINMICRSRWGREWGGVSIRCTQGGGDVSLKAVMDENLWNTWCRK